MGFREGGDLGSNPPTPSQNMQLRTAAKPSVLCCHLVKTNEESDSTLYQIT